MAIAAYYGVIPAKVRYSEHLKPVEKLLYSELSALSRVGGYSILDMEHLRKFTGCADSTIESYLENLEKCGFLKRYEQLDGKVRLYLKEGK